MKRKNTDISRKREQEKEMVTQMIQLYCRGNHHTGSLIAVSVRNWQNMPV